MSREPTARTRDATNDTSKPLVTKLLSDSAVFKWENQSLREDLTFVLPIGLFLCVGLAVGHPPAGMIAAGGAMTIGFGAKQDIDGSQLLPMILGTLAMAVSTFVGMVAGHENFLLVAATALWAFGYGMLTARDGGYAWVGPAERGDDAGRFGISRFRESIRNTLSAGAGRRSTSGCDVQPTAAGLRGTACAPP